ncbi:rCG41533 [Rattus norvegicus]|uniref:RCG41533 n=1 Tax=Rattus norvegicus TaxID=10116 RepID=A6IHJ7_RAT|nr:rCG41533 [Rattus norvegicus]
MKRHYDPPFRYPNNGKKGLDVPPRNLMLQRRKRPGPCCLPKNDLQLIRNLAEGSGAQSTVMGGTSPCWGLLSHANL